MKKKMFIALVFAVFASLAFAQYGPPPSYGRRNPPPPRYGGGWMDSASYLSLTFAVPIQWQSINYWDYGYSMDSQTVSLGVGIDMTSFFTRHLGLHVSADLFFPQTMKATYGGGYTESYKLQDVWDSDWGLSIFAGPSFALIRGSRVVFALAPGLHYYMLFAEQGPVSDFQWAFGIGANAELMFNVTHAIFLRAAVDLTWDFWGSEMYTYGFWDEYYDIERAINVTPQVGIGIRL